MTLKLSSDETCYTAICTGHSKWQRQQVQYNVHKRAQKDCKIQSLSYFTSRLGNGLKQT